MPSEDLALEVLRTIPGYERLFRAAFPEDADPVTFDNAVLAIGAFERRLATPSRFDDFLGGDTKALGVEELHGLSVFIDAGCPTCHAGPAMGSGMFQKLGLVHPYETEDLGRHAVTKQAADRFVFKVPSLRNVAETGPYCHDGSIQSLGEAVHLMAWHQVGRELSSEQIQAIVTFLGSLTGRIDQEYIARPALLESGPDTPPPDPSSALEGPRRFADPMPRAEGGGPVSEREAAALIDQRCRSCHRFEGKPESKFRIAAPDLMWGGQKYQHEWLVGWLQGREPSMYPRAYRWDQPGQRPSHPAVVAEEAEAIADYFEKRFRDPRVAEGAYDPSTLTEQESRMGAELFRQYSCIGCHQIPVDGRPEGGPVSTTFFDAGRRYDPDWVWAFNLDPPSFIPHSGEYVANLSEHKVRWLTGYLMTLGVDDFVFAKPWQAEPFANADSERGAQVYREYCAQCHGVSGEGDGPAASGPKPAVHARMAIDQLPDDYLYNVIFYGGKTVGKSALMPDWGLTLTAQQIADVISYMKATFQAAGAEPAAAGGACPQPRATPKAPPSCWLWRTPWSRRRRTSRREDACTTKVRLRWPASSVTAPRETDSDRWPEASRLLRETSRARRPCARLPTGSSSGSCATVRRGPGCWPTQGSATTRSGSSCSTSGALRSEAGVGGWRPRNPQQTRWARSARCGRHRAEPRRESDRNRKKEEHPCAIR